MPAVHSRIHPSPCSRGSPLGGGGVGSRTTTERSPMSDEAPQIEDTPTDIPAPEVDTPEGQDINWQKRYEDLRPEYDRKSQALADREQWLAHGQEHWPDLFESDEPAEEDEFEAEPEEAKPDPRVDRHDQMLAEIAYERDLNQILNGRDLPEQGRAIVDALCLKGGNSKKALELAVDTWFGLQPPVEEKKTNRAPHVPSGGRAATGVPNYDEMSGDEAVQAMVERARALDTQN